MRTAQQAFQELLARAITPVLKEHGFSRTGSTFHLRHGNNWGVINIQRSMGSTAASVRFTINLGVASGRITRFFGRHQPAARPPVWACAWRQRIGPLLPAGRDTWWTVDAAGPDESLARELHQHIAGVAIPTVRGLLTDEALRDHWLATPRQVNLELAVLLKALGPRELVGPTIGAIRRDASGKLSAPSIEHHLTRLERERLP